MKRIDLIVNRYSKDETTAVETNSLVYIQGTAATSDPVAPEYTVGNLLNGDIVDDCPILKIELDGLNITQVTPLLSVLANMNQRIEDSKTEAVYVVETGHTSFKHWIKYSDGTMEQWGSLPHPVVNLVSADGYLRYGKKISITFSEKFVTEPVVQVTLLHAKAAVFATLEAITTSGFTYWP